MEDVTLKVITMSASKILSMFEFADDVYFDRMYVYIKLLQPLTEIPCGVHSQCSLLGENVYYIDIHYAFSLLLNHAIPNVHSVVTFDRTTKQRHLELSQQPF